MLSGGTHWVQGQTRPPTVPTHERCVPQPRHSMALRTRQSDPGNTTTGQGGPQHCRHPQDVPSLGDPGAPDVASSAWGDSNNPKSSSRSYCPSHSTKLYNRPSAESAGRAKHVTSAPANQRAKAMLSYTAIIFVSPAPAPAGKCHPDTTGKQPHDPRGDVSAP